MLERISPYKGLFVLWGLAVFAWMIRYHPPGVDLLLFDDDARQHVYWTVIFQAPDLFRGDLLTEFISSKYFDPPGYQMIYRIGTYVMDPLPFSQLLSLILLLVSLALMNDLAKGLIPDPRGRILCGGLFLFFSLYGFSGGFPRGFAFPLLLGFLVLLQRGHFRRATAVLILEAILYPPVLLNTLALAGWALILRSFRNISLKKSLGDAFWLAAIGGLVIGVLFSVYGSREDAAFGSRVTLEAARAMPEFHSGGRSVFFRESLVAYLLLGRSGIGAVHLIGFAIILGVMCVVVGPRRVCIPKLALNLVWTSLLLFTLAHLVLFSLHLPSRYTLYTFPLAFMLTIGATTGRFLDALRPAWDWLRARGPRRFRARWLGWSLFGMLVLIYTYVQAQYICRADSLLVAAEPSDLDLVAFLSGLPKDTLVAGHPMDMDNVPLLARRKVLANHELSIPYYVGYYSQIQRRLSDFFKAYYASDWMTIEAFIRRYQIDVLVLRKSHFEEDFLQGTVYFEPFNAQVKGRLGEEARFAVMTPPPGLGCFENERYTVLCFGMEGRRN